MDDGSSVGTVVLVHGGFVDGSGWQGVYQKLTEDGYSVSVVQNPTLSLAGDADATRRVIDAQSEPVILVGHSYGGAVITEAGTDPNVKALVYIAGLHAGRRRVGADAHRRPAARDRTADSAAAGRFSDARPGQVSRGVRSGRGRRPGRVHGQLAGPVGPRGRGRHDQRARLAEQAKLVSRHNR